MSQELKPCPFCGGEAVIKRRGNEYTKSRSVMIRCPKCRIERVDGAIVNTLDWCEEIAIKHWNERVEAKP